jgi:acyl-coenzyme A synthetase/AMP-(fatty) acid ligase
MKGRPKFGNLMYLRNNWSTKRVIVLEGYKVPRRIYIEHPLPRNASEKILKYQLREKLNRVKA